MADLKPIGSEKLTGQEKINRIMQIARYKENVPSNINESAKSEYNINLADGLKYEIVKERQGYVIKRGINESNLDYIEPMKNRKYYSSYSQAFKRLNLIASELNRLNENNEGLSLFGEQKKFVLKTPKEITATPEQGNISAPPPVPQPELPPSPIATDSAPTGDDMEQMGDDLGALDADMPPIDDETPEIEDTNVNGNQEGGSTFKVIQKLTGKLSQKLRTIENEEGLTSENIKYVINMILSAVDLQSLSEEDKEDIMSKFTDDESDMMIDDTEMPDMDTEMPDMDDDFSEAIPDENEIDEMLENLFNEAAIKKGNNLFESKIDRIFSNYFQINESEISDVKQRHNRKIKETLSEIIKLSETVQQQIASTSFFKDNTAYNFVGKTNINNLVFEHNGKKVKINPRGFII